MFKRCIIEVMIFLTSHDPYMYMSGYRLIYRIGICITYGM